MGVLEALGRLVPVVLAFGAGAVFARRKIIQAQESRVFTDFTFLFAIPCYLFGKIYSSDLRALFDWHAIGAYAVSATVACVLVGVTTRMLTSGGARAIALRIMAAVQVNTAYYAVPVFVMLFGDAAPIFPILLLQVCLLSTVVIAVMEFGGPDADSADNRGTSRRLSRAVWASLNTPLVLACNLAIIANLVSVRVPSVVLDGLSFVGDAAAPVALFALGLYLGGTGVTIRGTTRTELALIAFKCLAFPLMTYALCRYVFGVGQPWLAYLTLIAAMPAPQNLFIFAQRYDIDVDLSASVVVKSSAVTILLLPLWFQFA
ncbi:AEC family transporter [Kibdelosporangium phytohabitans]|uniref:Transporter n=1 Tax=Kibdelosporangium phytohabitans TaxID=860235 RepID=A0A0N9I066_9PSEU|nr:AEC family transporter [Kibdelosporangium phytohabitans]ALG09214.1 transporter [Kibdelosporangium phytohabitans]MBE1469552.1 putative permease [Kibdelosporangium phytohabitans]